MKAKYVAHVVKFVLVPVLMLFVIGTTTNAGFVNVSLQLVTQLNTVKAVLAQAGPLLSAVLFTTAGIFYALGQIMPPDKRANFHSTSINIIIGAIVVGVLSVASTSLATASTHLLVNSTSNSLA